MASTISVAPHSSASYPLSMPTERADAMTSPDLEMRADMSAYTMLAMYSAVASGKHPALRPSRAPLPIFEAE